jgi:hypothetical protein
LKNPIDNFIKSPFTNNVKIIKFQSPINEGVEKNRRENIGRGPCFLCCLIRLLGKDMPVGVVNTVNKVDGKVRHPEQM